MANYTVFVDDNYHHMDEESRYRAGSFDSYGKALAKAKAIVDDFLEQGYIPGMTSKELFEAYTGFGEDPFIVPTGNSHFSAWNYARERCLELCRDEDAVASIQRFREWPPELRGFHAVLLAGLKRKGLGKSERKALNAFRRAVEGYPDAMPRENSWYWLRLEGGKVAFTVYLHADRFELHADGTLPEEVKLELRFCGTGRLDCRVGDASAALEGMCHAALAPDFILKASGG
jgi:hypothetical protein